MGDISQRAQQNAWTPANVQANDQQHGLPSSLGNEHTLHGSRGPVTVSAGPALALAGLPRIPALALALALHCIALPCIAPCLPHLLKNHALPCIALPCPSRAAPA